MDEIVKAVHVYRDHYNTRPVDFGDGVVFDVGEIHMDRRDTEIRKDGTQLTTYTFTCKGKAPAWTGQPIDEGFRK